MKLSQLIPLLKISSLLLAFPLCSQYALAVPVKVICDNSLAPNSCSCGSGPFAIGFYTYVAPKLEPRNMQQLTSTGSTVDIQPNQAYRGYLDGGTPGMYDITGGDGKTDIIFTSEELQYCQIYFQVRGSSCSKPVNARIDKSCSQQSKNDALLRELLTD
ncbi:MAG: hypothetical protein ACRC5A_10490 [Enterobacteriaceae bacterium]